MSEVKIDTSALDHLSDVVRAFGVSLNDSKPRSLDERIAQMQEDHWDTF